MIFHILFSVILPIFAIAAVGFLFDRLFKPHLETLSNLNFYIFVPALIFIKILDADLTMGEIGMIGIFNLIHLAILFVISFSMFSLPVYRKHRNVLTLGTMFYNAGNYGFPLIIFAFGYPQLDTIVITLMILNLLSFSFGIILMEGGTKSFGSVLLGLLKIPVIYAIVIALILRGFNVDLITEVYQPLRYLADGLISIALLTLGVQLSRSKIKGDLLPVASVTLLRLFASPAAAALLLLLFDFSPATQAVLITASALPVGVNVFIIASKYGGRQAEIASKGVFWSTVLSIITVSILLVIFRSAPAGA
ncbi:MAG: AEC family transporter [Spirochaetia bacterium]